MTRPYANERSAPVVQAHAELAAAARQLERLAARVEQETLVADRHRFGVRLVPRPNVAAVDAGGNVEAIVEPPAKRVNHPLAGLVPVKPSVNHAANVRLAVAPGVLEVKQVGGSADVDPAIPASKGHGEIDVFGVDGAAVVLAVAPGVLQEDDAAAALGVLVGELIVLGKLGHEHPAVLVDIEGHRAHKEGFRGH
jgi:hypothetical protein